MLRCTDSQNKLIKIQTLNVNRLRLHEGGDNVNEWEQTVKYIRPNPVRI